ncbi:MAG TPA: hypothetical protein DDW68_04455 [Verrucomicrobiales bacterium]|nr:hypothetical protein [Verrucomicrobiales bacterium]
MCPQTSFSYCFGATVSNDHAPNCFPFKLVRLEKEILGWGCLHKCGASEKDPAYHEESDRLFHEWEILHEN